jgi:hypothetical protein
MDHAAVLVDPNRAEVVGDSALHMMAADAKYAPAMDMAKLIALHGHFLAADAIKQFLFADVPVDDETATQLGELLDSAQFWSATMRLQVFYALLFVVVEGYREFGYQDAKVDRLLAQTDHVDALRRFRNAVFHPQEQPISPKLTALINAEGSETWTYDLYRALKAFFESQLPIRDFLARLSKDAADGTDSD